MSYELLYRYSGFFVDADAECLLPLDDALFMFENMTCCESEKARPGLLACTFLGVTAGSMLMEAMIQEVSGVKSYDEEAWKIVGSALLTRVEREGDYEIKIYPSWCFLPEHYSGLRTEGKGPVYSRHFWMTTGGLRQDGLAFVLRECPYRFKESFRDEKVLLAFNGKEWIVTEENLNNESVELMLSDPRRADMLELKPKGSS